MKKYRVRFSGWVWFVTVAAFALGALLTLLILSGPFRWWYALILLVFLAALVIPILYMPRYITFDGEKLRLRRVMGSIEIPLPNIRSTEPCDTMAHSVRLFGTPGYMGHMGYFRGEGKGSYISYVGHAGEMFWVLTPRCAYLFSCHDRDGLLAEIAAASLSS